MIITIDIIYNSSCLPIHIEGFCINIFNPLKPPSLALNKYCNILIIVQALCHVDLYKCYNVAQFRAKDLILPPLSCLLTGFF